MDRVSAFARQSHFWGPIVVCTLVAGALLVGVLRARPPVAPAPVAPSANVPFPVPPELAGVDLNQQSDAEVVLPPIMLAASIA